MNTARETQLTEMTNEELETVSGGEDSGGYAEPCDEKTLRVSSYVWWPYSGGACYSSVAGV